MIIGIVVLAAFQASRDWGDILSLTVFAVLGWNMKRFGWPRPPLILGLVLSGILETRLWISQLRYGYEWMYRPAVIIIALVIIASLVYGIYTTRKTEQRPQVPLLTKNDVESSD